MSITSARNFIEKSGCGVITAVLLAAIMGMSLASGQCNRAQQAEPTDQSQGPVVVKVGEMSITAGALDAIAQDDLRRREEQMAAQFQGKAFDGFNSLQKAQFFRDAMGTTIDGAVTIQMAKDKGIQLEDSALLDKFMGEVTSQISQLRNQLTQSGQLPANATEEQYLAKFKELTGGKTPEELVSYNRTRLAEQLKDPILSIPLKGQGAQMLWLDKEEASTKVSDAELDTIFDTVQLKSIVLNQAPRQNRTPDAEKILAEIKSGKISFEDAMDKYSEKPLPKDKKKHSETTDMLAWQFLLTDPNYGVVKNLKPGEVSGVIKGVDGPIIYKMISKKSDNEPKDFATNKEFYRTNHIKFLANVKFYRELKDARDKMAKFSDEGVHALYRVYILERDPNLEQDFLAIVEDAAKIPESNRSATIARLLAGNHVWRSLQGSAKTKFEDTNYIPAVVNFLAVFGPNPNLNITLVNFYAARKDAKAGEQLLAASIANSSLSDAGKAMHDQIQTKLKELQAAGVIKSDVAAQITANLAKWSNDQKAADEAAAARAAQDAQDRARSEAAMKKEKEAASKTPSKPSSESLLKQPR